ncbi:hypothetical protein MRB53_013732 [Persea americana]|uniref:Uncharacterized protein n=1 Tax=Persea americana TaxID=3435 RepID=A0ACC2K922_PERAE|nr:hypothetical protein MRB53_013732 [Persea americana]
MKVGCLSYAHIPTSKRTKLEVKSLKCVMLGVNDESKVYRLYDPSTKKIVSSRDVIFNEHEGWTWDDSHKEALQSNLDWGDRDDNEDMEETDDKLIQTASTAPNNEGLADDAQLEADQTKTSTVAAPEADQTETSTVAAPRVYRPPQWMNDFDSGEGLSEDENLGNFALFVDADPLSYAEAVKSKLLIVCLYVDDLIFTGDDATLFTIFKQSMLQEFDMTDLGRMRYLLGIEVLQQTDGIFIGRKKFSQEILDRFGMAGCNSVRNPIVPGPNLVKDTHGIPVDSTNYKQIVGSLMYLTNTRPDIMFVVSLLSRFMARPTELHSQAAKRVLRYVKGTLDFGSVLLQGRRL